MGLRISQRSTLLLVIWCLEGTLSGCSDLDHEAQGKGSANLVGGTEEDPRTFGIVNVVDVARSDVQAGTGTLLRNDWVLSAQHVVGVANAAQLDTVLPDLATTREERHRLDPSLVFEHPKLDVSLAKLKPGETFPMDGSRSGYRHELAGYASVSAIVDAANVDNGARCFGFGPATPTGGNAGHLNSATIPLFSAAVDAADLFRTNDFKVGVDHQGGDSGGPCIEQAGGEVLGVLSLEDRNAVVGNGIGNVKPPTGIHVAVSGFSSWANKILASRFAMQADFDLSGKRDTLTIAADDSGILQLDVDFDDDSVFSVSTLVPDASVDEILGVPGDFNGDGTADFFNLLGDTVVYYDGLVGAFPIPHVGIFSLVPHDTPYTGLIPGDFNGDSFVDMEASRGVSAAAAAASPARAAAAASLPLETGSFVDVYYGSSDGLAGGVPMEGFPTAESNDGKLLTLAVQPAASLGVPSYLFRILTLHDVGTAAADELHLEIFDGDLSGSHDTIVTNGQETHTCYQLYADPNQDGSGEDSASLLLTKDDTDFGNNVWGSLLDSSHEDVSAETAWSTADFRGYSYLLRVFISTDACDQPMQQPSDAVANAIKVRASGSLNFVSSVDPVNSVGGAISVRGSDALGDFAAPDGCTPDTCTTLFTQDVDTSYDGIWGFGIATTLSDAPDAPTLTDLWIAEADADSTLDLRSPGQATGSSATVNFLVVGFQAGSLEPEQLLLPDHPSGQFDPELEPCVEYDVLPQAQDTQLPPDLFWEWFNLQTHNNVWLAVPATEPSPCLGPAAAAQLATSAGAAAGTSAIVATLPLHGGQARYRIPQTTATSIESWSSAGSSAQIAGFLPLSLGNDASAHGPGVRVASVGHALAILRLGSHAKHHDNFGSAKKDLQAELLAAKLNVARGLSRGEPLDEGYVYGTTTRVADAIAIGDALLARACEGKECGQGQRKGPPPVAEMTRAILRLRAVNLGSVTHWPPVAASAARAAASRQNAFGAAPSNAGAAWFWSHD